MSGKDVNESSVLAPQPGVEIVMQDKWARNLLAGILASLVGLGVTGIFSLGRLSANVENLNSQMVKITGKMQTLIEEDMSELKQRITAMEGKTILPDAERRITSLEQRIRDIESRQ